MMRITLLFIVGTVLMTSCSQKFSLQKRKYNKGFYFASSKTHNQNKNNEFLSVKSKIIPSEEKAEQVILANAEIKNQENKTISAQSSLKNINFNKSNNLKNKVELFQPKILFSKSKSYNALSKTKILNAKKNGILEFLENAYIGYILIMTVLAIIAICIFLFSIFPPQTALLYIGIGVLVLVLLSALGASVR